MKHSLLLSALALSSAFSASAQEAPLWEAGVGLSSAYFNDYPGASNTRAVVVPFPYFVYRGDRIKVDRRAIRGILADGDDWSIEVGFGGTLPVKSDDNERRVGMDDLDPVVGIGPKFSYRLGGEVDTGLWSVEVPVHANFASDFSYVDHVGWTSTPQFRYRHILPVRHLENWSINATAGVILADERYFDYVYGVDDEYATSWRPAYEADGGYGGWRVSVGMSRRIGKWWFGSFARYRNMSGSAFEDSPLVEKEDALSLGVAVAWIFAASKEHVDLSKRHGPSTDE
tara:strand:+ start:1811 stop:2665 length:855 start_codon:yes stop_codon:yes gene_type:complete